MVREEQLNWPPPPFNAVPVEVRLGIFDSLARYSWAIDAGSIEDYLGCFVPDAILHHPQRDGTPGMFQGHEGIRGFIGASFAARPQQSYAHQHQFTSPLMRPEGDDIRIKAFCTIFRHEFHRQYWPSGPSWRMGSWHGVFTRPGDDWKIREVEVRMWTDSVFGIGTDLLDRGSGMPGTR